MIIRKPWAAAAVFAGALGLSACDGGSPTPTAPAAAPTASPPLGQYYELPDYTGDQASAWQASQLGIAVMVWYVDNDGPPPEITVEDGRYLLDGGSVGPVMPGVTFQGITGTGADDWCLWVTNPSGSVKDVQYTPDNSFEPGNCSN